ncbi:MAG: hypothetical protein HYU67_03020 [Flavobacteriia bacterium]|nr:hypothetical protein [Flavobacteriia bacterium]
MEDINKQIRKSKLFYTLFDSLSLLALLLIMQNFKSADPGEFIFLFAYESQFILISFFIVLFVLLPIQKSILKKKGNLVSSHNIIPNNEELKKHLFYFIGFIALFFVLYLIFLFLNQLSIEMIISYTKDNGYIFNSLEILNQNTVFVELSDQLGDYLNLNINYLVAFFVLKHIVLFLIQILFNPYFKKDASMLYKQFYTVGTSAILSPLSMFFAMLFLVICSSIFGAQKWIPLLSIVVFQLIFRFSTNRISSLLKGI